MKVIVAGSRSIKDYALVAKAIEGVDIQITELVSGTAKGVDQLGERWATENQVPIKRFPADWKNLDAVGAVVRTGHYGQYNAKAGFDRNKQMADYAEALVAVYDGKSKGTASMIKLAREQGLQVFVYKPT